LTRYFTKKREFKVKKLVGGNQEEVEEEKPVEVVCRTLPVWNMLTPSWTKGKKLIV